MAAHPHEKKLGSNEEYKTHFKAFSTESDGHIEEPSDQPVASARRMSADGPASVSKFSF